MFQDFKTEIKILVIVTVASIIIVAGGIFLLQNILIEETPQSQSEVLDTSGWKTYRNDEFGFEVKHPSGSNASRLGPNYVQQQKDRGEVISGTVVASLDTIVFSEDSQEEIFRIEIFASASKALSQESYEDDYLDVLGPCDRRADFTPVSFKEINVDSVLSLKVAGTGRIIRPGERDERILTCVYTKNLSDNLLVISSYSDAETIDQILSTFIFITNQNLLLYDSKQTGISFAYPQELTIVTDEDGDPILPNLFFSKFEYPTRSISSKYACPQDCIIITSFIDSGGRAYYDIPAKDTRGDVFPVYEYPKYVHQDETGSEYFKINGLSARRYYAAGVDINYGNRRARDPNAQKLYELEERIYIEDPYLPRRLIRVTYYEIGPEPIHDPKNLTSSEIKQLFNEEQYRAFRQILSTIKIPMYDIVSLLTYTSDTLGVSFAYPAYWGKVIETQGSAFGSDPPIETLSIFFKSSLFSWDDPAQVRMEVDNAKTADLAYESPPPLYQYSGQSLDTACEKNAYLASSGSYDIKLTECNLRTLSSGTNVVVFAGDFAYTYEYGEGEIPVDKRKFSPFKGAILQTKSSKWPGMTIHFEGIKSAETENVFDKIINSLMYE